jgi:LmbE family N-acetylglucosaminyl deacetylase
VIRPDRLGAAFAGCLLAVLMLGACQSSGGPLSQTVSLRTDVGDGPRILCVVAHPDDETTFAATLFKSAVYHGAAVDIAVVTNGEGGFKYATLAERLYQKPLTDEKVGRAELPAIRKREFLAGCRIMGVRTVHFLDQTDSRYSLDAQEVLSPEGGAWDVPRVRSRLRSILDHGRYDFVLTLLPHPLTHGHHKAATILALEAVAATGVEKRPVILAGDVRTKEEGRVAFRRLKEYPQTEIDLVLGPFVFDRSKPFGHKDRLNYKVVVNWVIAEYKSQGTMQLAMNRGDEEAYYLYKINAPGAAQKAEDLFRMLEVVPFKKRVYGASAGTNR